MTDDTISRHAAIEVTCYNCTQKEICNGICDDTDRLRELPTIEPKHGKWIKMSDRYGVYWVCSECGEDLPRFPEVLGSGLHSIERTNCCPYCGVMMGE